MKQVVVKRRKLTVDDVPPPTIEKNHVLVATFASLISSGTERSSIETRSKSLFHIVRTRADLVAKAKTLIKSQGLLKTYKIAKERINESSPLGYCSSGVVIAVGDGVEDIKTGDRVACAAPHSEINLVPKNLVVKLPENVDFDEGAFAALGGISLQSVRRADIKVGDVVVVIGLGVLGLLTVQIARAAGATVFGMDPIEHRVSFAKELGATYASSSIENLNIALREYTKGHGADSTIVTASSTESTPLRNAITLTRKKGKVVIVGSFPIEIERQPFYEKELDVLISCSIGPGRYDPSYEVDGVDYPYPYVRWTEKRNMEAFISLVRSKRIDVKKLITHKFSIDDASKGYELLNKNPKAISVVLEYEKVLDAPSKSKIEIKSQIVSSPQKIRVGLIGAGNFARSVHIPNLQSLSDIYDITAICTHTGSTAKYIAENCNAQYCTTKYQEILADKNIDMVIISTRHDTHARIAIDAVRAGKNVFLEKPAAINRDELQELINVLRNSNVHFMVGFNRRYAQVIKIAKDILKSLPGRTIISYHVNAGPLPENHWTKRIHESGGRIIGECVHFVDLIRYLVDSSVVDASAVYPSGKEKYENIAGSILFADDSIGSLVYGNVGPLDGPKEIIEIQKGGTLIRIDDFKIIQSWGRLNFIKKYRHSDKGHKEELRLFAMEIKGKIHRCMSLDEIEEVHTVIFKWCE